MTKGRFPTFLCIGAGRSGTTWLYECLKAHPEAFVPPIKEVSFFIQDEYRTTWMNGLDWYQALFASKENGIKAWGELSPRYYFLERTPALIHHHIPDVKIIFLLRHPVAMLHSLAAYHVKMYPHVIDGNTYGFLDFIDHHLVEPLGFFAKHYKRYASFFPKQNILVSFYEDLMRAPRQTFASICHYLGIAATITPSFVEKRINPALVPRHFPISVLLSNLRPRRLFRRFDERFNRVEYKKSKGARRHRVSEEAFHRLMLVYQDDIHELEGLTGRDLGHWFHYENLPPAMRTMPRF